MQRHIISHWIMKDCPEGDEEVRTTLVLRLLFQANEHGLMKRLTVYRVQQLAHVGNVVGARLLKDLHTSGFLKSSKELTEVVPYDECIRPSTVAERILQSEDKPGRYFDPGAEPTWAREPTPQP